jgi:hypothetical protein
MTDITKEQWLQRIGDPQVAATIQNGTLPTTTLPPTEVVWKLLDGFKKAQDAFNADRGTMPRLATVDLMQIGPAVETDAGGRLFVRGRAQVQCRIFLDTNDVQGVTII